MKNQRPNPRRPHLWKTFNIHSPADPLARLLSELRIRNLGKAVAIEVGAHWPNLAANAARQGRIPLLMFRDVWSGGKIGLLPKTVWLSVYHPAIPPGRDVSGFHVFHMGDLVAILRQYAAIKMPERRIIPNQRMPK